MNATSPKIVPRSWQKTALTAWMKDRRGVVQIVTGGGKTVFAQLCSFQFLRDHTDGQIAIVVPTISLLDQWVVSLVEDAGIDPSDIACFSAEEKPTKALRYNLLVVNTARLLVYKLTSVGKWMLIVDECHRVGSPQNAKALQGKYLATLGLSATPQREYDDGFNTWVVPVLGPIIYEYGYIEASKDGVITEFALHNVRVKMLQDEQHAYDSLTRRINGERGKIKKGVGSEERLVRLLQQRGSVLATVTMRIPVAIKLAEQHLGQRTIIFHERVAAADSIVDTLIKRHRSVTVYHASLDPAVRRDNLRLYRRGVYDILVCCRALDEGINVPETAVAIVASSTASLRQRIQRLGRVLRPAPGKTFANVYTIYASDLEGERLRNEAANLGAVAKIAWSQVR